MPAKNTPRWIMFTSQNIPGNQLADARRVVSLTAARRVYEVFCESVGTDNCSATLYPYTEENWEETLEHRVDSKESQFTVNGCPLGYPSKTVERGNRGGIKIENA